MALSSLTQLKSSVRDWAKRQSLGDSLLEDFVTLTESVFNHGERADDGSYLVYPLRVRDMETGVALTAEEDILTELPNDFLQMINVRTSADAQELEFVPPEWWFEHDLSGRVDHPPYYSVTGNSIRCPVDTAIIYYAKIPSLVADGQNWLLTKAPNAYLYGCLMQYSTWDKDAEKVAGYRALMNNALGGLNFADINSRAGSMTRRASMPAF